MDNQNAAAHRGRLGVALALAGILSLTATGCNKLKARDMLNKGVQAYKANQYDEAVEKFKEAEQLDPDLQTARIYLATAYANLYSGVQSEQNLKWANQAVEEFKGVLARDSRNLSAIDGIGSLRFQMAAGPPFSADLMKESRSYHEQHIKIKPDDPEPYYWIGVIDWTLAFRANAVMRLDYNRENLRRQVKDTEPLPSKLREEFAAKYGADVDDGIGQLKKAIELRPDYDDAMAYLNLLERQKADTVESREDRDKLLADADALIEKVKEIKQKKAAQPAPPQT
jgi:tetratricopeptide (TPR) repeat protein